MKALLTLKPQQETIEIYAHNLDNLLADSISAEFNIQGIEAVAFEQEAYHSGSTNDCQECLKLGQELLASRKPQKKSRKQAALPVQQARINGALGMVSNEVSRRKARSRRAYSSQPGSILSVLIFLVIVGVGAFMLTGQKAPGLEAYLAKLAQSPAADLAPQASTEPTAAPDISTAVDPFNSPTAGAAAAPTPTVRATRTPAATVPPTPTPTVLAEASCLDALEVSRDHAGQTVCVTGTITQVFQSSDVFILYFSRQPEDFYILSYDRTWEPARVGGCVQLSGVVQVLNQTPVMAFGWTSDISTCP